MKKLTLLLAVAIFLFGGFSDSTPKVLIIGDSISIGYFPYVQEALAGRAEVVHNPGNAEHTGTGLKKIGEWLGDEDWDVIHFNWGLWDLCYRHPDAKVYGNRDKINGTLTFTVEEYGAQLDSLVRILKTTGAELIFAATTYVPTEEAGRFHGDEKRYNAVALEIMKKYGVTVNDLRPLSKRIHAKLGKGKDDVHYEPEGYRKLGAKVSAVLRRALRKE
jgi:lysophospholipase L1-like esterase